MMKRQSPEPAGVLAEDTSETVLSASATRCRVNFLCRISSPLHSQTKKKAFFVSDSSAPILTNKFDLRGKHSESIEISESFRSSPRLSPRRGAGDPVVSCCFCILSLRLYSDIFCAWRFAGMSWVTQLVCMAGRKANAQKPEEASVILAFVHLWRSVKKSKRARYTGSFLQKDWPSTHASVKSLACTGLCADQHGYQWLSVIIFCVL